tara:strand:+ start:1128 stop:2144 length:1017 start_codon:yes stop_codon:yes gene_type:complete
MKPNPIKESYKSIDLVAIGNAIVDILINTSEEFIKENNLDKGSMSLIDEKRSKELISKYNSSKKVSGGSAANTACCLSKLGDKAHFIGRIKNDEMGRVFSSEIRSCGVSFQSEEIKEGPQTAHSLIFITPDAQRTMCTFLGSSTQFNSNNIDLKEIEMAKILYLEGYLWDHKEAKLAFIKACNIAKRSNTKIALSLSDKFCVERHKESLLKLINERIDVLFGNEDEYKILLNTEDINPKINWLRKLCNIAIITMGEKGSIIITNKDLINIEAYKMGDLVDTTGAGDAYAGGFISGLVNGKELEICGKIGSICAGKIVTEIGSKFNINISKLVKSYCLE